MKKTVNLAEKLGNEAVFKAVSKVAKASALPTYVVGGYVRDLMLRRPCKDIDFVCVGDGIALAKLVAEELGAGQVAVYKNFGTAQVRYKDLDLEFVGARKESYRKDSRKPEVDAGTLEDDQRRRDFTINALAIDLYDDYGALIDPFDGMEDLRNMMLCTPLDPNTTFDDDPLRMMRAIRFSSQLTFDIAPDTFDAIMHNSKRLEIVSQERITDELNKIILSPVPSYGFKLLFYAGLLHEIFPEMVALHGVEYVDNKAHKDNFFHTLQVLDNVAKVSDDLWLRWAAILHDIAKPATKRFDPAVGWTFHGHEDKGARMVPKIFRRMKLPLNHPMLYVQKLVRLHLRPISLANEVSDSAVRRLLFEAGDAVDDLMALCRADITSKNKEKVRRYLDNFNRVEKKMAAVEAKDHIRNFQPPVSGDEIMEQLKVKPGKAIGIIKEKIKEAILDGKIRNDREEALALMWRIAKEQGVGEHK